MDGVSICRQFFYEDSSSIDFRLRYNIQSYVVIAMSICFLVFKALYLELSILAQLKCLDFG